MIETIKSLLEKCPEAYLAGGDVIVLKDGKHVSLGRSVSSTDGAGSTTNTFVPSEEGRAILEGVVEKKGRAKPQVSVAEAPQE